MGKYDVTSRRRNGIRAAPAKVLRRWWCASKPYQRTSAGLRG